MNHVQDQDFDFALSLGDSCDVAQNLRRYFRTSAAYPFDWWRLPWPAPLRLLDEDFQALLQAENLSIDPVEKHVFCQRYGIWHIHDFIQDSTHKALPEFATQLPFLREKFQALIRRMDQHFSGKRVLAVRRKLYNKNETLSAAEAAGRAQALLSRLQTRWPTARINLLVVDPTPHTEAMPVQQHISYDWLDTVAPDDEWSSLAWDKVFLRQNIAVKRTPLAFSG